ncbi:MAG: type II secretion system protein GspM [Pseudomonadota bacterium]
MSVGGTGQDGGSPAGAGTASLAATAGGDVSARAAAFVRALSERERWMLGVTGALLALAPALRTLARAPAELVRVELQWQEMQRLAAEAQALRAAPTVTPEQAQAALKAATDRLGERARLTIQGERAVLTVTNLPSPALRDWLSEVRQGARALPLEASLTRGATGLSGSLVLAIGGRP